MDSPDPDRWIEEITLSESVETRPIPKIEISHSPTRSLLRVSLGSLALEAPIHPLLPLRTQKDALVRALISFRADPPLLT